MASVFLDGGNVSMFIMDAKGCRLYVSPTTEGRDNRSSGADSRGAATPASRSRWRSNPPHGKGDGSLSSGGAVGRCSILDGGGGGGSSPLAVPDRAIHGRTSGEGHTAKGAFFSNWCDALASIMDPIGCRSCRLCIDGGSSRCDTASSVGGPLSTRDGSDGRGRLLSPDPSHAATPSAGAG